ncbi:hypothetical protein WN48_07903 [Eufriesea mexicana]|uniref:Uncharacterized protein n=1 Tax=Eufriesea mexicana TaxID=516756 RepID=A0A310SJ07_9HYME|nr:hypothetical protein WN48_07903 [Eufriesea mexicana]
MYVLNQANGNENNSTKFRYLNDCLHSHASDLANPNTNTMCKLASVSKSVSIRRHPVYARAHGRIGEKNTRLGKVRNREGTTRALRKSGAHNKDGTTPMKKDAGRDYSIHSEDSDMQVEDSDSDLGPRRISRAVPLRYSSDSDDSSNSEMSTE